MAWTWPWRRASSAASQQKRTKPVPTIPEGAVRRRLRYVGRVQAVGFRFTVDGCAEEAGVTGWVKNMDDGSVLCEVQGTSEQVACFLDLVQKQMDSPKTWIRGSLESSQAVEPKPDTRFSILNL